jgi:hypothetical protein
MVIFGKMFRDIAEKETRVITTFNDPKLGSESYAMVDVYCVDPACDCRRVMINVIRDRDTKHLATINWAFDPKDPDRGPFLDRLNTQSPLSNALLKLFKEEVITDKRYVERLERHYKMVKDAVANPDHEVHNALKDVTRKSPETSKRFRTIFASASTDQELGEVWKEVGLDVHKELVDETLRRGESMVPILGDLLLDEELWDAGVEDKAGWAPAHALKLLTAIGGPKVIPYAVEFFRGGLGGDWLTDEGDNFVLSLGPKGIDPMFEVVKDEDADFWGRVIAVDGLAMLGLAYPSERSRIVARIRDLASPLMEKPLEDVSDDEAQFLLTLLEGLATLHDEPAREWIERAAKEERCGTHPADLKETLKQFDAPFEEMLKDLRVDPLMHFHPTELARLKEMYGVSGNGHEEEYDSAPRPTVREEKKVGRNDPCPCGSGKKYKKCCLST